MTALDIERRRRGGRRIGSHSWPTLDRTIREGSNPTRRGVPRPKERVSRGDQVNRWTWTEGEEMDEK